METQLPRIRFLKPDVALRDVVRFYTQREASLRGVDLVHPVPARAATMLEFIFSDPFEIHWCERPLIETTPRAVIVGLQTYRRVRLVMRGSLESFSIVFQPAGLFRLFSIPAAEFTNRDDDAHAVIGPSVSSLHQRLGECSAFEGRARIADQFLLAVLRTGQPADGVLEAANHILQAHGDVRIGDLATRTGLQSAAIRTPVHGANRCVTEAVQRESRGSRRRSTAVRGRRTRPGPTSRTRSVITIRCI